MAGAWNQAIELQRSMMAYYQTDVGSKMLAMLMDERAKTLRNPNDSVELVDKMRAMTVGLFDTEPYYWSPEMCRVLLQVAKAIPDDWAISREHVPPRGAFMYFATSLPILEFDEEYQRYIVEEQDAELMSVRCIALRDGTYVPNTGEAEPSAVFSAHVTSIEKNTGYRAPIPMPFMAAAMAYDRPWGRQVSDERRVMWNSGEDPEADSEESLEPLAHDDVRRFIAAAVTLLDQRITVVEHQTPDRTTRKRYGLTVDDTPTIRVVTLRKPKNRPCYEGTTEPVDWSHRWLVAPHFHTYGYGPGHAEKHRRLVLGYVKGPEHLPLKVDGGRIFNVAR